MPLLLFFSLLQSVRIAHNDSNQSGANTAEIRLTPSNVKTGSFGKLCSASINGTAYNQPLYVKGLSISGQGVHDTIILGTMNNNVYAIDRQTCAILWTINLGSPWTNYSLCCTGQPGGLTYYGFPMGIVGTGVIDSNNKYYVVNALQGPSHVLSRINLSTGTVEASVTISGSVSGSGNVGGDPCASGGILSFCSVGNQQTSSLALSPDGSKVYFGLSSWENGVSSEHGWLFAYNTSNLTRAGIFCTSPNGYLGSPWMARGAPSIDASGNVYVVTGNGDTNASVGSYAEYVLQFSPTLSLTGTFLNPNYANDNSVDADFGSNRFLLIGGGLGVAAGKDFSVYSIALSGMTQSQTFKTNGSGTPASFSGSYGGMFMNGMLYLPTTTGPLYAFSVSGGAFNTTPVFTTSQNLGSHNGQLSGSANGVSNGILWQVTSATSSFTSNPAGTLRALNAATGTELWNSDTTGHDTLGLISKFAAPTIADGTVIVTTNSGTLVTFGLLPTSQMRGQSTLRGNAVIR